MVKYIYGKVFSVVAKKPIRLWGMSLLADLLTGLAMALNAFTPMIGLAIVLVLNLGIAMVYLAGIRGGEINSKDLFVGFYSFARTAAGMGWMFLWQFIWGMVPVMGIIKAYSYRFTPYILADYEGMSPNDALKKSMEMTQGYKGKMFLADILLAVGISVGLSLLMLLSRIPYVGILFRLILVVAIIAVALFAPLVMNLIPAAFYEEITHRRVCPRCGVELSPDARFCYNCGYGADGNTGSTPELPAAVVCPQCGAPVKPGTVFCGQCGCRIN